MRARLLRGDRHILSESLKGVPKALANGSVWWIIFEAIYFRVSMPRHKNALFADVLMMSSAYLRHVLLIALWSRRTSRVWGLEIIIYRTVIRMNLFRLCLRYFTGEFPPILYLFQ